MSKPRYQKPQAVKDLERLAYDRFRLSHPNFPVHAIALRRYRDDTANGLTRCIIDYIRLQGGQAERINTTGIPVQQRGRIVWRKAHSTTGSADISATIAGRSVKIEVKIGPDRQSEAQRCYQVAVEYAGGLYFIAKDFTTFVEWFDDTFNDEMTYGKSRDH